MTDTDDLVGKWPRCEHCDELLMRDSGRCQNPVCPGKRDENEDNDDPSADPDPDDTPQASYHRWCPNPACEHKITMAARYCQWCGKEVRS